MNSKEIEELQSENQKLSNRIFELEKIELEYKNAEIELRKSEEKFRTIFENTGTATCIIDENATIVLANARFAQIAGYAIEEIVGKIPWTEFVVKKELKRMLEQHNLRRSHSDQALKSYEFRFQDKHGNIRDIFLTIDVIPNTKKSVASLLDITERKRIEAEERNSRHRFKSLFDQAADGILVGISTGEIIEANNSMCVLVGYKENELIGSNIKGLFDKTELITKPLRYDLIKKGESIIRERTIVSKDGQHIPVEMSTKILNDGRMQAIFRDITERKKSQKELILAKEKAEESDRLKTAFLANMSHEIRTPMNSILGFTNLLNIPNLTVEKQHKYIDIIKKSGRRMLETVNDLIDISHIETGQVVVTTCELSVNEEMKNLYDIFEPEADKKGLQLIYNQLLNEVDSNIITDQIKINSILTNLIKNAIKYTDEGQIEMSCIRKGGKLEFCIKDSGIGIPTDRHQAIFNRFVQADIEDKRAFEGSGLGLAISKAYIEMLEGNIWLTSEEKKGSSFYFTLPWKPVKEKKNEPKNEETETGTIYSSRKLKILIAEDDEVSYQHLLILLEEIAYEILQTHSGMEAIQLCIANPDIDLVLMDIKMPQMNGYKATREIRKFNKQVVIIAQTAYALTGDREKALKAGCDEHLTKPINSDHLMELIHKHIH